MEKANTLEEALIQNDMHYFRHTYYVVLAWKLIRNYLIDGCYIDEQEFQYINNLIIWHDNSKIESIERIPYAKKFYLKVNDDEKEEVSIEFKKAAKHHKDNNLHHYESLISYEGIHWKCYVIELICDYIAMGWEYNNYIFDYYDSVRENINLRKDYKDYLEYILSILKQNFSKELENPLTLELASRISNMD